MGLHAVVVGASSGIGAAAAAALAARGYEVTGLSRRPAPAASRAIRCDVTAPGELTRALAEAAAAAPIDALVYAAGAPVMGVTAAVPEAAARAAFEVNFWGLDVAARAVAPSMASRGRGAIAAVLSLAALRAVPHEAYYAAAKAAAARYLDCLAHELGPRGVAVGYVCPGFIDTGFLEKGGWFGMSAPRVKGSGTTVDDVARAVVRIVEGRGGPQVLGWRERAITVADRVAPGLYDRVLRARSRA